MVLVLPAQILGLPTILGLNWSVTVMTIVAEAVQVFASVTVSV